MMTHNHYQLEHRFTKIIQFSSSNNQNTKSPNNKPPNHQIINNWNYLKILAKMRICLIFGLNWLGVSLHGLNPKMVMAWSKRIDSHNSVYALTKQFNKRNWQLTIGVGTFTSHISLTSKHQFLKITRIIKSPEKLPKSGIKRFCCDPQNKSCGLLQNPATCFLVRAAEQILPPAGEGVVAAVQHKAKSEGLIGSPGESVSNRGSRERASSGLHAVYAPCRGRPQRGSHALSRSTSQKRKFSASQVTL